MSIRERVEAVITTVLEYVYVSPRGCRDRVLMHLRAERDEAQPRLVELEARVEKLETMLVWSYNFSPEQRMNFYDHEESTLACGGRPPDPIAWGVARAEDDYDSQDPDLSRLL